MRIAVATRAYAKVVRHAGQAREWLVFEGTPGRPLPEPAMLGLSKEQALHHFEGDGPHPLDGVDVLIAGSAGEGFVRHMAKRGAKVMLTGETDPRAAAAAVLDGKPLPAVGFDPTRLLCKIHDLLFSRH